MKPVRTTTAVGCAATLVMMSSLFGAPQAAALEPPTIDPTAVPADGAPTPPEPMRQGLYCRRVGTLPGTDYRVQPHFLDMLNVAQAWQFGRGAGQTVAVIDTGVTPHPRLPHLVGGGDYIVDGGDGLSDCDAHGTLVASLIGGQPADGHTPLPPPMQARRPETVPTTDAPPPPQTVTVVTPAPAAPPPPPPPPPPDGGAPAGWTGPTTVTTVTDVTWHAPLPADTPAGSPTGSAAPPDAPAPPPPPPPPAAIPADGFTGVAPDVTILSIRQSAATFSPRDAFGDQDPVTRRKGGDVRSMASAIVHAANMGATVINISEVSCMEATNPIDQRVLGAAIYYAAVVKNVVLIAAAGNTSNGNVTNNSDCKQNPIYNPLQPGDPRDWQGVNTIVTPAWFSDYVLSVGAVDAAGNPLTDISVAGPWVGIAAPGTDIVGLSPRDDGLVNAVEGRNNDMVAPLGTSFSAAIVSGVAALVRAKYPNLTAHQVINRLIATARPPARGIDNQVGHGIVDPVAALTWDVPAGEPVAPGRLSTRLIEPPPHPGRDMAPTFQAMAGIGAVALLVGTVVGLSALIRSRRS